MLVLEVIAEVGVSVICSSVGSYNMLLRTDSTCLKPEVCHHGVAMLVALEALNHGTLTI